MNIRPFNAVYARLQSAHKDHRGVDLTSDALAFGRLWYMKPDHAVDNAKFFSLLTRCCISLSDAAGNVIETHPHSTEFKK